jgi:hypothetical protein
VTFYALKRVRLFDAHLLVASEALLMIGALHSRPQQFLFVEGLAMATVATGRLLGSWAVMMARLANCTLLAVKILSQPVVLDFSYKPANNLAVWKINRIVLSR